jgi:hypothetical protein
MLIVRNRFKPMILHLQNVRGNQHGIRNDARPQGHPRAISVHRAPHLLCSRALEVLPIRLRARRLTSAAPCKRLLFRQLRHIGHFNPVNGYPVRVLLASVFGSYACNHAYGSRAINPMELYQNQVARVQGAFPLRMFHRSFELLLINHKGWKVLYSVLPVAGYDSYSTSQTPILALTWFSAILPPLEFASPILKFQRAHPFRRWRA